MSLIDTEFAEAASNWNLKALYDDLASAKNKHLTPKEKVHLRGLLCGHSPSEIAEKLQKSPNGVETDLSASIYKYVKSLVDKGEEKVDSWRSIVSWLEEAGYKTLPSADLSLSNLVPEKCIIYVTTINVCKEQIVFQINLQIPTASKKSLDQDNLD